MGKETDGVLFLLGYHGTLEMDEMHYYLAPTYTCYVGNLQSKLKYIDRISFFCGIIFWEFHIKKDA